MSPDDPENPQNWHAARKVYASMVATAFAFAVAFGITSLTVAIQGVMMEFQVSMTAAVLGLSLNLLGIAFAPITTPHLSERFGRSPVYLVSLPIFALFILGAGYSKSFAALAVCRFFAGFFAPIILGYVVPAESWRWTQYVTLMIALAAFLLGVGVPETYPREIVRTRARRGGYKIDLAKAESGVTLAEMAGTTLFTPLAMAVSDPVVVMITIYLALNFAVLFQWFIAVPAVLALTYGFTLHQAGLAFIAAVVGALVSTFTSSSIEGVTNRRNGCTSMANMAPIEYRLVPGMFGSVGLVASLFWIGFSAKPTVHFMVPIVGTGVYVWSSMSILTALVSYIFDAYPAKGTLSALTLMATTRLIFAAWLPLVVIQMIMGLQGQWAYSVFGFLAVPMIAVPIMLFIFGPRLRARSRYSAPTMSNGKHPMNQRVDQEMQMGSMHH
ncbi:MAG: hypothetical protein LQ348_001814 [Seirophora lacunosa]|nr:MAG: hypothetical protein LQ348_001814 [Seirophora lacunosa]